MAKLKLRYTPIGVNGTCQLTALVDDEPVHADKCDIGRASSRQRFVKALAAKWAGGDAKAVEAELLRIVGELTEQRPQPTEHEPADLDASQIVRPELFHTPEVSGVAVPVVRIVAGEPRGTWELLLRWHADGTRERRTLESCIETDSGRLWVHPMPGPPTPTQAPGWSGGGRRAWLSGAPAPEPCEVFKGVCERIGHYLDFPCGATPGTVATLALWTWLSYVYPAWTSVPYLAIGGPLASGKSSVFRVLGRMAFRPLESSNMTAACLFRTLHEQGGTLLLDEAERLRDGSPDAGELRSILLSGYKRGSPAMRLEKQGDKFQRVTFDVYTPKAVASIGRLPEALASRCIHIGMFRAAVNSEKPRRRLDAEPGKWATIRDGLHALALEHGQTWVALADRVDVVPADFAGRDFELWQPLLALAGWLDEAGVSGLLELVSEHARSTVEGSREESVSDTDELVLRLLAAHVQAGTHDRVKAGDLLREAQEHDGATFARWKAKGIANSLKRYGIRTRKGHGSTGRVYGDATIEALSRIQETYAFDLGLDIEPPGRDASGDTSGGTCEDEELPF